MAKCVRPTLEEVFNKVLEIANRAHHLPKTTNKGKPGQYLEQLTGIPTSSECLDCLDGEVKVFPLKKLKNGAFTPKETIAVTMINNDHLKRDDFTGSKCAKKISKILYIPYYREGDMITYMRPTVIDILDITNTKIREQIEKDYNDIRNYLVENGTLDGSSSIGIYLQNRTKGAGKDAPKTRAFYFRPQFMKDFISFTEEKN